MSFSPLRLHVSRFQLLLQSIIYFGALLCLYFSAAPWALKIPAGLFLLFSAKQLYDRSLLQHPQSITQLQVDQHGRWLLFRRHELQGQPMVLRGDSLVTPWVVVLNFKSRPNKTVIIWYDSLNVTCFRRLRVYLRTITSL